MVQRIYVNIINHFAFHDLKAVSSGFNGTAGEVSGANLSESM